MTDTDAAPVLEVRDVSKHFPGVRALDAVSLSVAPGEVHALVGENGAGKSTLIKVITGVYQADSGEIRYRGAPVTFGRPLDAQRAGISTIYQEVNLIPLLSIARNLFLGREPRRFGLLDVGRMNRDATEVLAGYGVDVDVTRPLRSMSLGAQQMVALARAVAVDAKVLVMDEPTSSLEPREVQTLFRLVRRLSARGIAVVYVSHRLDELYQLCDRVTVLRDGRVVHTGALAGLDRLRLVSAMLGRDLAEVRRDGVTGFTGDHTARDGEPVLRVEGLRKRHLLHDVSFTVRPGEVTGLGGLLGSGRSETAKAVVGALPLDAGTVTVAGRRLRRPTPKRALRAGVALLPEDRKAEGIIPELSVRENIVLAAMPRLARAGVVSRARQDRIVETFMTRLRIRAASPEQRVGELSGGNQQKVLLARWLCLNPRLLLLDEPTRGIDVGAKAEVQKLVGELARDGLGVVLISSDLEELVEGADRVVVLRAGAVVGELAGADVSEPAILATLAAPEEAADEQR
ncbi:sugar ABC transporter ATP-binding protein [Micromonospora sp. 4G55]|uniref:sugar ABC transporter ATP-binding protein n=1 Tax=Micromonospora sp. 4G55 TaxID=2806102 RepID=UPI001A615C49|nr:sugar ABC transporter ATP-binding protein [Micromonospora sp. 4G55]MBM0256395.1 sugar ABC transporter ATP-binding protein [Micromonospora sp. 4G55]